MAELKSASAGSALFETWQPDGVIVHSGEPAGRGFTLHEDYTNGSRGCGFFECDPAKTTYELTENEMIYVLEGEARIELEDGSAIEVKAGDAAFLPKGHMSTWTFHTRFREFWVLAD